MMNPASKGMKLGGLPAEVGLCPMPKGPKSSIGDWAHHHPVHRCEGWRYPLDASREFYSLRSSIWSSHL
jgi:hypothetical protein